MYKMTGSTNAFAGILVFESAFSIFVQLFASVVVDDGRAKQCAVFSDFFRGVFVLLAGIIVGTGKPHAIYIGVIAINLVRPFYRTSMFAIGPLIAKDEKLAKYSARNSVAQQSGQLIGAGIAGAVISILGASACVIINGVSFIISALLMCMVSIPTQRIIYTDKKHRSLLKLANPLLVAKQWWEMFRHLFSESKLFFLVIICTIDYLVVSFINLAYAPVIDRLMLADSWMSIWDCLFAIGAIIGALLFSHFPQMRNSEKKISVFMFLEAILLVSFAFRNGSIVAAGMLGLGVTNAFSVSSFSYELQSKAKGKFHGRIAGLKQFLISLMSIVIVPFFSKGFDASIEVAVMLVVLLCLVGALTMFFAVSRISAMNKGLDKNVV